jgi:hypothetical protein
VAPLSSPDTAPFLPHKYCWCPLVGSLPSTACFSTRAPTPCPPSDWFRLFSSQKFSRINTPTISSRQLGGWGHSHLGPPWCCPTLSARSRHDPHGGYCHPCHTGRQTDVNTCGITFTFPPTDRSGPDRLFWRGITGLVGRGSQRQTRGLELATENETGELLRDYTDGNSYLILGLDTPTTNPYNPFATPDVLDIVITKKVPFPVYLTSCSELSSDHLPVVNDTACRSSVHHPPSRADFRRTDWAKFQIYFEDQVPFDTDLHNEMAIDTCVENFSGAFFLRFWRYPLPSVASVTTQGPRYRLTFRMKYA